MHDRLRVCKWIFLEPEATLRQDGAEVGTHSAGPRWTWKDGSAISGKVTATSPSANPSKNIPSLELAAAPVVGTSGFLTTATRVSRTETQGGVAPPGGCDAQVRGEKLRVSQAAPVQHGGAKQMASPRRVFRGDVG